MRVYELLDKMRYSSNSAIWVIVRNRKNEIVYDGSIPKDALISRDITQLPYFVNVSSFEIFDNVLYIFSWGTD